MVYLRHNCQPRGPTLKPGLVLDLPSSQVAFNADHTDIKCLWLYQVSSVQVEPKEVDGSLQGLLLLWRQLGQPGLFVPLFSASIGNGFSEDFWIVAIEKRSCPSTKLKLLVLFRLRYMRRVAGIQRLVPLSV